jgi:hypothetical protein
MPNATITEAQARERERRAFVLGVNEAHDQQNECRRRRQDVDLYTWVDSHGIAALACERVEKSAEMRYPKPTRPREVLDPFTAWEGWLWSARRMGANGDGELTIHLRGSNSRDAAQPYHANPRGFYPTPERVALWADLLANPTEADA